MNEQIKRLRELEREVWLLGHTASILNWDQETYMPPNGIDERSEQLAYLSGLAHEKLTNPEIGKLLAESGCTDKEPKGDPGLPDADRAYLRALYRAYSVATKLPTEFVQEKAMATSKSQNVWADAKTKNDFSLFLPHLEKMVDIARREAAFYGFKDKPYDGLLDQYEPGLTQAELDVVFGKLRKDLVSLLDRVKSKPQVDDSFLHTRCDEAKQERFGTFIMQEIGYDLESGRLDRTAHPFSTTLGTGDSRITTRYIEDYFPSSVFSTLHESGHALYELGLPRDLALTAAGSAASMAVHESQSRTWENIVGRSRAFWTRYYPALRSHMTPNLDGVGLDAFLKGINKVEPSFIRTEADEVTYGLHVILRYNLEKRLINGTLEARDVPAAWNAEIEDLLGIVPPNDTLGCLQDVHWSCSLFGYFPSYALGNLYGAQFWATMKKAVPDVDARIASGDTDCVLSWLRSNVHSPGSTLTPGELVEKVTGESLNPKWFMEYLTEKYSRIYGF